MAMAMSHSGEIKYREGERRQPGIVYASFPGGFEVVYNK